MEAEEEKEESNRENKDYVWMVKHVVDYDTVRVSVNLFESLSDARFIANKLFQDSVNTYRGNWDTMTIEAESEDYHYAYTDQSGAYLDSAYVETSVEKIQIYKES